MAHLINVREETKMIGDLFVIDKRATCSCGWTEKSPSRDALDIEIDRHRRNQKREVS